MKNQYGIDYQQGYDNANKEWLDRMDMIRAEIEAQIVPRSVYTDKQKKQILAIIDKYRNEVSE